MEIKTKFGIGDKIWVISQSKAKCLEIGTIVITNSNIRYGATEYCTYTEPECFPSKEALLTFVASE